MNSTKVKAYSQIDALRAEYSAQQDIDPHQPGAKLDAGKPDAALLGDFGRALLAVAEVGTFGAQKYTRGGWLEVPNGFERYSAAMWRHLLAENRQQLDPESGLTHAAHAAWGALARLELMLREREELQDAERTAASIGARV